MIFLINSLIFFYVGASCVNFTIRYGRGGAREASGKGSQGWRKEMRRGRLKTERLQRL